MKHIEYVLSVGIKTFRGVAMACWWGERTCSCDECMLFECPYNINYQEEDEEEEEENERENR